MKTKRTVQIAVLSLVTTLSTGIGNCQIYQFSEPLSGQNAFYLYDQGSNPLYVNPFTLPGSFIGFAGTVSDTVVIDAAAQTIRQFGSVSFSASPQSVLLHENESFQTISTPVFPNPPITNTVIIPADLTLAVTSPDNASFDTGAQPLIWNGQQYSFNGNTGLNVPLDVSYSLVTGGQTYAASVQENVDLFISLGSVIDTSNYPETIALNPSPNIYLSAGNYPASVANLTAQNGFQVNIELTPEPSLVALLAVGLFGLTLLRRRQAKSNRRAS